MFVLTKSVPTGSGAGPCLLFSGYRGFFFGVLIDRDLKLNTQDLSSADAKNEWKCTAYSSSMRSWHGKGELYVLYYILF